MVDWWTMRDNRDLDSRVGYVYILTNPTIPGALKIGMSSNHPLYRSYQLSSSTGVPTPFHVAYYRSFSDCVRAETIAHNALAQYRVSLNREFFNVGLDEAIRVVDNIAEDIDTEFQSQRYIDGVNLPLDPNFLPPMPYAELFATFIKRDKGNEYENVLSPREIEKCQETERQIDSVRAKKSNSGTTKKEWRVSWDT